MIAEVMLALYRSVKFKGAGDTGPYDGPDDEDPEVEEKAVVVPDGGHYLSRNVAGCLTHLTADMNLFDSKASDSDYERWKTVFNRIEHMEEIQYFACIRSKTGLYGRFSSIRPLEKALLAALAPQERRVPIWLEALMSLAPVLVEVQDIVDSNQVNPDEFPQLELVPEQPQRKSECWTFFRRIFSFKKTYRLRRKQARKKVEYTPDIVYKSLKI